jgi:hypothetical protein
MTRASRVPRIDMPPELRDFLDKLDRKIPNHNLTATGAPTVNDDGEHGYQLWSIWIDSPDVYMCVDTTAGAAVWTQIG